METVAPTGSFAFEAPLTPSAVHLARTYVCAMAAACWAEPDLAADLGLAVAELASVIVAGSVRSGSADIDQPIHVTTNVMSIRGEIDGHTLALELAPWGDHSTDEEDVSRWDLVAALFDTVQIRDGAVHLTAKGMSDQ